jgi:aryl-alcohol dehydrogenase-like predicted oxidoreductase
LFTRANVSGPTRIALSDIDERDPRIAREVDAVADELGVSPSQISLAWTMARYPSVHPIVGSRSVEQLLAIWTAANEADNGSLRLPHEYLLSIVRL